MQKKFSNINFIQHKNTSVYAVCTRLLQFAHFYLLCGMWFRKSRKENIASENKSIVSSSLNNFLLKRTCAILNAYFRISIFCDAFFFIFIYHQRRVHRVCIILCGSHIGYEIIYWLCANLSIAWCMFVVSADVKLIKGCKNTFFLLNFDEWKKEKNGEKPLYITTTIQTCVA